MLLAGYKLSPGMRAFALACCLAAEPFPAAAQGYVIELDAPQGLRLLLEDNLDVYRWREGADETQRRFLLKRTPAQVRELLETEGYYSPLVTADFLPSEPLPVLSLRVEPGEPVRVVGYDLRLRGALADDPDGGREALARMHADWGLKPGGVFRHPVWEKAKRDALLPLLTGAYPTAHIAASRADVDPEQHQARLDLEIDSGPAFRFGETAYTGLRRYPVSIVERLNPIRPGEPYSQARLLDFQVRLRDSPYFASVSVSADPDPAHPDRTPVQVALEERAAKKLGFGLGVSTDAGPRASAQYQDLGLFDRAWRLSASAVLDTKRQTLVADLDFPLSAEGYRDSLHARTERTDIEDQVTRANSLGAKRTRLKGKAETVWGLDYTSERQDVAGRLAAIHQALTPSYTWTRRAVDDLLFPRRGYLLSLQGGGGARALLSDRDFLRGYGRIAWFHPLGRDGGLILRGELGAVRADARSGIPSDLLFRTGGDQSVRGYGYQSLGVKDGSAVVGGRYLAVASAEYVRWLYPEWGFALFYDAGDAADHLDNLALKQGYGLGLRWKSPVGPLNLDAAHGEAVGGVRLHFSASLAF